MPEVCGTRTLAWQLRFHDRVFDRDTMGPDAFGRIIYPPAGYMSASPASTGFLDGDTPLDAAGGVVGAVAHGIVSGDLPLVGLVIGGRAHFLADMAAQRLGPDQRAGAAPSSWFSSCL